jgi:hypothetical protein
MCGRIGWPAHRMGGPLFVKCVTATGAASRLHCATAATIAWPWDNQPTAVMTQETEAAAPNANRPAPRQAPDLLGVAYLATIGIVMTAWIGGLIWAAMAVRWWIAS